MGALIETGLSITSSAIVLDRPHKIDFLRRRAVGPRHLPRTEGLVPAGSHGNGVPVVGPRRGGLTEIVEKTGGAIPVDPDDTASPAQGIFSLWKDPALLERLGKQGVEGVREHYSGLSLRVERLYL